VGSLEFHSGPVEQLVEAGFRSAVTVPAANVIVSDGTNARTEGRECARSVLREIRQCVLEDQHGANCVCGVLIGETLGGHGFDRFFRLVIVDDQSAGGDKN